MVRVVYILHDCTEGEFFVSPILGQVLVEDKVSCYVNDFSQRQVTLAKVSYI